MNLRELLSLSFRALRANKMRSTLTMLGVILGVFAVIMLVSIGSGLQNYITSQISGLGSNLTIVIPGRIGGARTPGGQQTNKLVMSDAKKLEIKLRAIADVGPVTQKTVTLKYKNRTDKGASVLGTTANYPDIIIAIGLERGKFFTKSQD